MLKYHVAVCDDEKSDLDGIVQSVQQYDVQGCFDIETYMDGNELLSELQMQKKSPLAHDFGTKSSVLHLDRGVPLPDTKSPMANTSAVWSWDLMLFRPSGVNSNQS